MKWTCLGVWEEENMFDLAKVQLNRCKISHTKSSFGLEIWEASTCAKFNLNIFEKNKNKQGCRLCWDCSQKARSGVSIFSHVECKLHECFSLFSLWKYRITYACFPVGWLGILRPHIYEYAIILRTGVLPHKATKCCISFVSYII